MPWKEATVVYDPSVRKLCPKGYPGHKRGCPNYGKKGGCPPQAPLFIDIREPKQPTFVIWNRFDFGAHVQRMQVKHPEWTERQCACCRYWQGTARKDLKTEIKEFQLYKPMCKVTCCPEGMGINVTATMKQLGVVLEWPPVIHTYQVAVGFMRRQDASTK